MSDSLSSAVRRSTWLLPVLVAGLFAATGCWPGKPGHTVFDWLLLALLYLPFLLGILFLQRAATRGGLFLRGMAALGLASGIIYLLWGQTGLIHFFLRTSATAGIWLGVALLLFALPKPDRGTLATDSMGAGISAVALVAGLLVVSMSGSRVRDHLFRHHRPLGAMALFATGQLPFPSPEEFLETTPMEQRDTLPESRYAEDGIDQDPRSLVFIMIDTLRADVLELYGAPRSSMPNLEAFAAESIVFEDAWANATWTRPSVGAFFTGRLPEQIGLLDENDRLIPEIETLAERFQARGYETVAFMTNPHLSAEWGFAQGFEHFFEVEGAAYPRAEDVREAAEEWISSRGPQETPLFLYVHFMDPHTPYRTSGDRRLSLRQYDRELYRSDVAYLDRELSFLLQTITEKLNPSAAVFVTSDHGEEFGEHGAWGHDQSVYPELTRIPAILHLPESSGRLVDLPLEGRDFHWLLSHPDLSTEGLVARARQEAIGPRVVSSYRTPRWDLFRALQPWSVIRTRGVGTDHELLIWNAYGDRVEVYDLHSDPGAHRNQASAKSREHLRQKILTAGELWLAPVEGELTATESEQLKALGYL